MKAIIYLDQINIDLQDYGLKENETFESLSDGRQAEIIDRISLKIFEKIKIITIIPEIHQDNIDDGLPF